MHLNNLRSEALSFLHYLEEGFLKQTFSTRPKIHVPVLYENSVATAFFILFLNLMQRERPWCHAVEHEPLLSSFQQRTAGLCGRRVDRSSVRPPLTPSPPVPAPTHSYRHTPSTAFRHPPPALLDLVTPLKRYSLSPRSCPCSDAVSALRKVRVLI